jgi:hypothetical protein
MTQRLGAPPVWRAHEDPKQAITPPTSDGQQGMIVKATLMTVILDSDGDSQEDSESGHSRNTHFNLETAPEAPPTYAQAKGALPTSISRFDLEQESSVNESSGARSVHLRLPTRLIVKWKRVKEAGDLHRTRDYSQVRNKRMPRSKPSLHPVFIDTKRTEKYRGEPPVKSIQIPSQPSGDRHGGSRGVLQRSSTDMVLKSKAVNTVRDSSQARNKQTSHDKMSPYQAPHSGEGAECIEEDSCIYEPFLKPIRIPSQKSAQPLRATTFIKAQLSGLTQVGPEPESPIKNLSGLRTVQPQSSTNRVSKPKEAKDVSQQSQRTQPQLGSEVSDVHGAFGSRSEVGARTRRYQKSTVVYITRAR